MQEKIQLIHPQGKKLSKMELGKYEPIKLAILESLKTESLTHDELLQSVRLIIGENFEGSVAWYTESVKLDLEGRNIIARTNHKPQKYCLIL